jgi:hypothetical protein
MNKGHKSTLYALYENLVFAWNRVKIESVLKCTVQSMDYNGEKKTSPDINVRPMDSNRKKRDLYMYN